MMLLDPHLSRRSLSGGGGGLHRVGVACGPVFCGLPEIGHQQPVRSPLVGPGEGRDEVATFDFVPLFRDP